MGIRRLTLGNVDIMISFPGGMFRGLIGMAKANGAGQAEHVVPLPAKLVTESPEARALQQRVDAIEWYHTIDLGNGVVTPGWFDLRHLLDQYPIPSRLDGKRVLDVATFDGFWAYEFERRGAAEVVAMDIDSFAEVDMNPRIRRQKDSAYFSRKTGEGFALAHEALHSKARRQVCNVYDLSPERLGKFDFVFVSDLLLHLMNPMKALNNIASVTEGQAVIAEVYDPHLPDHLMKYESGEGHNIWWSIGLGALHQMVDDAGFRDVELCNKFKLGYRGQKPVLAHAAFRAFA
jgi:tRNA (mo5U34)-methyltransferase